MSDYIHDEAAHDATSGGQAEDPIAHLDFTLQCGVLESQQRCPRPAIVYAQIHRTGACRAPICDEFGNMSGPMCQLHIDLFWAAARQTIAYLPGPGPFGSILNGRCSSCGMPIRAFTDIVQRVERI